MKTVTGVQLWSLRQVLLKEPESTFEKLASAGYTVMEPAGFDLKERSFQGFKTEKLKQLANNYGLEIISGHFPLDLDSAPIALEQAAELGMKYFIIFNLKAALKASPDGYKIAASELNELGKLASAYGMKVGYHNHAHEFEIMDGIIPFDILLKETDPELVVFQPDLGWLGYAKQDPVKIFRQFPGRFPIWHLRDMDADTKQSTAIGSGFINFQSIFANSALAGLEYAIVEMASDLTDPLSDILSSHKVIESWV